MLKVVTIVDISFSSFTVELRDALRMGAIIKGMDLDEEEIELVNRLGICNERHTWFRG